MRCAVTDLLVCLVIQILFLTGIGGAAHSGTMAGTGTYALCGTAGAIDAPDAVSDRHCLDCVMAVAGIDTGAATSTVGHLAIAAELAPVVGRIAWDARSGALRIRAPPA